MPRVEIDLPESWRFSTELPIRVADLNYGNHLGNDRVLSRAQEVRVQWLQGHGLGEHLLGLFGVKLEEFRVAGLKVLLLWVGAFIVWRLVLVVADRIVVAADDGDDSRLSGHEKRAQTIAQLLRGVGRIVIVLMAVVLTLNQFVDITPLLGGAGILALAVSFGAQSMVKDVIGGFFILMENQFAVGDVIEVAGKTGTVEKMSLRVVMLRDMEGTLHIVPNGQITTVSNRTRGWSRAVVDIGVAYDLGVNSYIVKPVDFASFADVVKHIKVYWILTNEPPFVAPR